MQGVAVSVGPALAAVCQPLFAVLLAALRQAASAAQVIAEAIRPAYEPLTYAVCLYIIGTARTLLWLFAAAVIGSCHSSGSASPTASGYDATPSTSILPNDGGRFHSCVAL